ncbi:hypothetical protein [Streptococcus suis]|uniref:hypothetical protein n=1 Tax=Streptococcus suis TaxID=1307 RepID=UPI00211CE0A3|nr:hypothetical protein [Streptococcus suis]UUM60193.1 hypothetical protein NQZ90_01565 [Streptococcus suis]HEL2327775.1 hypothetical protein [Streptococcus suis]
MSFLEANEKIAEKVVGAHKATENAAVSGFNTISDKFIEAFFTKDNETVEEAKARMSKMDFNQPNSSKGDDK